MKYLSGALKYKTHLRSTNYEIHLRGPKYMIHIWGPIARYFSGPKIPVRYIWGYISWAWKYKMHLMCSFVQETLKSLNKKIHLNDMQIYCTLFVTASPATHKSTVPVLSQNATNQIHSDSMAMHRIQAESTFIAEDSDTAKDNKK